ncbi:unnamed protein product, partial [Menidia menidia]
MHDSVQSGLDRMPAVEPAVASLIVSPDEALREDVRCPRAQCRITDGFLCKAYNAGARAGRLGNSLAHLMFALQDTGGADAAVGFSDAALQAFALMTRELGRLMSFLVQARRQVWLAQSTLTETCRRTLRSVPVVPGELFGSAALEALQRTVQARQTRQQLSGLSRGMPPPPHDPRRPSVSPGIRPPRGCDRPGGFHPRVVQQGPSRDFRVPGRHPTRPTRAADSGRRPPRIPTGRGERRSSLMLARISAFKSSAIPGTSPEGWVGAVWVAPPCVANLAVFLVVGFGNAGWLGLDKQLLLLKTSEVDLTGLPPFYSSVINAWQTLKVTRTLDPGPGMWVNEEPLFNNDFLRSAPFSSATLRTEFVEAGMNKLGHLVNTSMDTLGDVTNVRSSRLVSRIVEEVWQSLVLKSWNLMETKRVEISTSLNWLLLEPVIKGSRLGSAWDNTAMISERLVQRGVVTLKHLLELVGSEMEDVVPLARRLEIHSLRIAGVMLTALK